MSSEPKVPSSTSPLRELCVSLENQLERSQITCEKYKRIILYLKHERLFNAGNLAYERRRKVYYREKLEKIMGVTAEVGKEDQMTEHSPPTCRCFTLAGGQRGAGPSAAHTGGTVRKTNKINFSPVSLSQKPYVLSGRWRQPEETEVDETEFELMLSECSETAKQCRDLQATGPSPDESDAAEAVPSVRLQSTPTAKVKPPTPDDKRSLRSRGGKKKSREECQAAPRDVLQKNERQTVQGLEGASSSTLGHDQAPRKVKETSDGNDNLLDITTNSAGVPSSPKVQPTIAEMVICEICKKSVKRTLWHHHRALHVGYFCTRCDTTFTREASLKYHIAHKTACDKAMQKKLSERNPFN